MSFEIVRLLEELGIEYKIERANAYFKCPLCVAPDEDPGTHMGARLDGQAWGCWRNPKHSGRNPFFLVRSLTGWPVDRTLDYLGHGAAPADTLSQLRERLEAIDAPKKRPEVSVVSFPQEFRKIEPLGMTRRFWRYLVRRKFARDDVAAVTRRYALRCALTGRFSYRLVLPVLDRGKLVGWTARAIGAARTRYLAHPPGNAIRATLFNAERARGGSVLALVEGPMDAVKLDFYGRVHGLSAVAAMGMNLTAAQETRVRELVERYGGRLAIVLDAGTHAMALRLAARFADLDVRIVHLPDGVKDPGDLPPRAAERFAGTIVSAYRIAA